MSPDFTTVSFTIVVVVVVVGHAVVVVVCERGCKETNKKCSDWSQTATQSPMLWVASAVVLVCLMLS